jgi:hypothetical protein
MHQKAMTYRYSHFAQVAVNPKLPCTFPKSGRAKIIAPLI